MTLQERSRHCRYCSQTVYSLEEIKESEVVDLLQQKVCVRVIVNPSGHVKTHRGFSTLFLLGGLLACGETSSDAEVTSETEQSVEVLQVNPGQAIQLQLDESIPTAPPPPVMGKIAPPTLQKKELVWGKVDTLHDESSEPVVDAVEEQSATIVKED